MSALVGRDPSGRPLALAVATPALVACLQGPSLALFGALALACVLWRVLGGRRFAVGGFLLVAWQAVAVGLGLGLWLLVAQSAGPGARSRFGAAVTATFLAAAAPRLLLVLGRPGEAGTLALGLLALMGMARLASAQLFGVAVLVFIGAGCWATLVRDSTFSGLGRRSPRLTRSFAGGLGATALGVVGLGVALPAAQPAVSEYLEPYLGEGDVASSGYQDGHSAVGGLKSVLVSNEIWARLSGPGGRPMPLETLRTQVYQVYRSGTWRMPTARVRTLAESPANDADLVQVEHSDKLLRTLPVPRGTTEIGRTLQGAALDDFGVARRIEGDEGTHFTFRLPSSPDARPLAPPEPSDLMVPPTSAVRFAAWLQREGVPAGPPAEVVRQLVSRLSAYEYKLDFDEPWTAPDPLVDFLERFHAGHCELFASAFVLLARVQGVPARYVTGFRVEEFNPWGGWHVVRGRDAHAWAEVYVDGRWQEVDPTPAGGLEEARAAAVGPWAQRIDVLGLMAWRAFTRLQNLTETELAAALLAAAALGAALLVLRGRRARGRGGFDGSDGPGEGLLARLDPWLARVGVARPPHVPPFTHARVCEAAGHDEAARLLRAFDALRYGGVGDPEVLARDVDALARRASR